jgi:hypothetical protein
MSHKAHDWDSLTEVQALSQRGIEHLAQSPQRCGKGFGQESELLVGVGQILEFRLIHCHRDNINNQVMKELWQSTDVGGNKNSSNEGRKHLNGEEKICQ